MGYVLLNGKLIQRSEAKVDVEDRGYQFGDGVYEVIRVYNGKMFTAVEHLNRLTRSLKSIGVTSPYTSDEISGMLEELIDKNKLQLGIIYMQVTRGAAPRNHAFPDAKVPPVLVAYTKELARPAEQLNEGVAAITLEDIRWLRCDIKSLNLLGNVLAKQKAVEQGCFEAIQHRGDNVTEGSSSNIYMVRNGVVLTHPSNNLILKGITKDVVLSLCNQNQIQLEERSFTLAELSGAEEVFLTSTTGEVTPIVEINGKKVNDGNLGSVTRKLQQLFHQEIERQCGALENKLLL